MGNYRLVFDNFTHKKIQITTVKISEKKPKKKYKKKG